MTLMEFIRQYFTLALITRLVENRTPVSSVVFDRVFTNRQSRATSQISLAQVQRVTKSMPVISRGGMAIPLDPRNASVTKIEPLSIRLSDMISGAQLNELRALYGDGGESGQALVSSELDKMVLDLMSSTELTRNALCAQAITGKIDYMMDSNGMKERYVIDYGTTLTHTVSPLLDDSSATLVSLVQVLQAMHKKINQAGYAGTPIVLAGSNAFATIANLIMVTNNADRMGAEVEANTINVLGYEIILVNDTYNDANTSGAEVTKDVIDTNKICMLVRNYTELDYLAIDDVQGNLVATPFFSKTVEIQDPSGIKVISESKPIPLVAPQAICWATVTASMGSRTNLTINIENTVNVEPGTEGGGGD